MTRTQPKTRHIKAGDITLAYHEWVAPSSSNTVLIAHATGFHGRCYDPIAESFPEHRVIAVDLHGHGQSTGEPIDDWQCVVDELCDLVDALGIKSATGVGHSMGGHAMLRVSAARPDAFSQLVLFDPVILAPEFYEAGVPMVPEGEMHPTARRKRDFASPQEMIERFATREPYSLFRRDVFENYCRYGLTPCAQGGYELACSPEMEASMYMSSLAGAPSIADAARVSVPATIVRAMKGEKGDFKGSPTWPALAAHMPHGIDMHRLDRTHFHPFEDPHDAARIIAEAMEG
ncbi:alpha/beta hydrolase [Erythrobacter sp. SCSIO 43205]|uniref:alpha/beta fold hydrolase n=1 Tax=Erythrobacter sp. SCSIO 43205 TaxID=2779361 RepID=UPI001CA7F74D|nr:alpha/beta hydrolase [Erythrobacter sp. SCSIO 43205]UAB78754.1 alpha/beta hydrolase [Erythrobacter sp. SCSIO 43205]